VVKGGAVRGEIVVRVTRITMTNLSQRQKIKLSKDSGKRSTGTLPHDKAGRRDRGLETPATGQRTQVSSENWRPSNGKRPSRKDEIKQTKGGHGTLLEKRPGH